MTDKRMSEDEVVGELSSGMTIGIGGWGSRRKPMSLVRAILRSNIDDLTIVSYGGPDVGLLLAAGKVRRLIYGFVSLDSIALEPHFRRARQSGAVEAVEYDEGMLYWGLYAAACRLPFLPTRAGLGSDVLRIDPTLRTVRSPYDDEELVAMPALRLDAALVHLNRADAAGNAVCLGPDPYFDDLFCAAAQRAYVSCEQVVATDELTPTRSVLIRRHLVRGVVHAPNGAHFTSCDPDYGRDEQFQQAYAEAATAGGTQWDDFRRRFLDVDESGYQRAVAGCDQTMEVAR